MVRRKEQGSRRRRRQERVRMVVMAGRENENRKEKEKEGGKFGRQFFRLFFSEQSGERLRIPPSFNQYLQNQPTGVASLKAQSGNTWLTELASDTEGLFFGNGWKEFVRDHSIEMGDLLTFRYDGRSQFSVVVFDGMCIEKPSAFHAKPCKDLVVKLENDEGDMDMNASDPSELLAAHLEKTNETTGKRNREMDANGSRLNNCTIVLGEGNQNGNLAASTGLNMDMNAANPSEVVPLEEINGTKKKRIREMDVSGSTLKKYSNVLKKAGPSERLEVPLEKSNGTTRKRVREMDANGSTLKKCSTVSEKESDSSGSMIEKSISCNKSAKSLPMPFRRFKDVPKRDGTTGQRQPAVISQRPPVTEEQKNYALQKAKQFKSKYPFTLKVMKACYVYVGFFMIIPCEFVRECLPRTNKKFTLWDPQGNAWEVNYFYFSERSAGAFSAGWSKFSLGNHLEKFDVCVFELFSKDNIKVHIYRANPEITPFLPGSSNK